MPSDDSAQRAVEAVSEAYAKATPGEWRAEGDTAYGVDIYSGHIWIGNTMNSHGGLSGFPPDPHARTNVEFVVAAKNNWPAISAHIAALTAENAKMREIVSKYARQTKDGVWVGEGDTVYVPSPRCGFIVSDDLTIPLAVVENGVWRDVDAAETYSTAAMAAAARPPAKGGE